MSSRPPAFRGTFRDDAPACAVYSEAAGIAQIIPEAVAVPADVADVAALVRWAASAGRALIPRGSGSSMAGGAIGQGIVVDLSRLASIEPVDAIRQTVRCGPGALRNALDTEARKHGLTMPVDPSSGAFCTVGGMVSTNAAGAHTVLHGSMREWVQALDCVFADGSRAELRRGVPTPDVELLRRFGAIASGLVAGEHIAPSRHVGVRKESSGYGLAAFAESGDLVDLIIGSEGTLALIVGVELRLAPARAATASLLAAFATLDSAVTAAISARSAGASACELIDRTFLDVAREGGVSVPAPATAEVVLLVEVEGDAPADCAAHAAAIAASFRDSGALEVSLGLDETTERAMWELRHAASPVLGRLDPSLKSMQFIEDGCVPPDRLAEYVLGVRAALAAQGIRGVIFGHAGDAHVHVNPLIDIRELDWRERADALLASVTALIARLGGTVSGEHGDGRLRAPLLPDVWPAATLERFAAVKAALDPHGLLNPGAKLVAPAALAIDRVKYDPTLPPLPRAARAALDRVERERAYSRSRLDLLDEADGSARAAVIQTEAR